MHRISRLSTLPWLLMTALLQFAVPGEVRAAVLKARSPDGDLVLVSTPGRAGYVSLADGSRVILPLAPKAVVHSFAATGGQWYAAAVETTSAGRRLVVLKGAGSRVKEVVAPAVRDAAQLREPSVFLDDGGLRGLAWIEGKSPRGQIVRLAGWAASGWQDPVTVSPAGPGSQMALTTAALGDGSRLLAWTAFDGTDDEVLWSRWSSGGVTPPQRLGADNAVPDITPHLWATPGGALAAWSRYDGNDYRLHLARFDGLSWSQPEPVGPRGSVYPTFHSGPDGPLLVYLQAVPRAWVVAELDARSRIRRQVSAPTLRSERPLLQSVSRQEVSLIWIESEDEAEVASGLAWSDVRHDTIP